jgi:hypothetical protein
MELVPTPLTLSKSVTSTDSAAKRPETMTLSTTAHPRTTTAASLDALEILIPDSRADVSPAQSVERKLTTMLRGATIPVSHIRLSRLCGKR